MSETSGPAPSIGAAPTPALRIVPGAPPPAPLTKSQLKKRKKATVVAKSKEEIGAALDAVESPREAALVDHVPSAIVDTLVAGDDELKANLEPETPASALSERHVSPIIDQIINKRIKHFSKKLQRIQVYSSKPEDQLNEDQKKTIQTVPQLEAVTKELEEVKKLIEAHESAQASKLAEERAAEAQAVEQRIRNAVEYSEAQHLTHTRSLVAFIALSTLLAAPFPVNDSALGDHRLPSDETEKAAVIEAGKILLTPEFGSGEKDDLIKAVLGSLREGSYGGVQYDRLREIAGQFIHPPTPIPSAHGSPTLAATTNGHSQAGPIDFTAGVSLSREATPTPTPPVQAAVGAGFLSMPTTGSFQFMSASDLDLDPSNDITEQEAPVAPTNEWVHVDQAQAPSFGVPSEEVVQESPVMSQDVEKLADEATRELQAQAKVGEIPISNSVPNEVTAATLDWAAADDEDQGLPSIDSLEQQFGKSGAATPVSPFGSGPNSLPTPGASAAPPAEQPSSAVEKQANGHAPTTNDSQSGPPRSHGGGRGGRGGGARYSWGPSAPEPDADGFASANRSRGGRGVARGGEFRGGDRGRGGFRGGDRDSANRGGYRGGYRGGEGRGGSQGRPQGEWNGEGTGIPPPGGEGFRGRGRGGGRGGYRGWSDEDGSRGRGGRGRGGFRGRGDETRAPPPVEAS